MLLSSVAVVVVGGGVGGGGGGVVGGFRLESSSVLLVLLVLFFLLLLWWWWWWSSSSSCFSLYVWDVVSALVFTFFCSIAACLSAVALSRGGIGRLADCGTLRASRRLLDVGSIKQVDVCSKFTQIRGCRAFFACFVPFLWSYTVCHVTSGRKKQIFRRRNVIFLDCGGNASSFCAH